MTFRIIISALIILCSSTSMETNILLHPKSRIAPVGTEMDYCCKINGGVNPHWVINDYALDQEDTIILFTMQGFLFEKEDRMSTTTLTLRVNVTADKNGTEVYCSSLDTHSDIALLITINELPLSPNPSIENPTASTFLLKWSPPYLWPGHSLDYYKIAVSKTDGSSNILRTMINSTVNATFSDTIVTFVLDATLTAGADYQLQFSSIFLFRISAVSYDYVNNDTSELAPFFVVGGYLPGATVEEYMPVITQSRCNSTLKPSGIQPMEESESDIKVSMGILLGIALLVSIVLAVMLLVCIYTNCRRQKGRTTNNADFNEMVLNPIYDGPMYETILKVDNLKEQPSCYAQQTHTETNLAVDFSSSCCDDTDISKCLKGENKTEQNFQLSLDKVYTMSPTLTLEN